jgi:hypothetical protein
VIGSAPAGVEWKGRGLPKAPAAAALLAMRLPIVATQPDHVPGVLGLQLHFHRTAAEPVGGLEGCANSGVEHQWRHVEHEDLLLRS